MCSLEIVVPGREFLDELLGVGFGAQLIVGVRGLHIDYKADDKFYEGRV